MGEPTLIGDYGLIPLIIASAAFIVALLTLFLLIRSFLTDHERRRKQATIEYYEKISSKACGPLREAIGKLLNEPITNYSYRTIMPYDPIWVENQELHIKCFKYCRKMERFAAP